MKNVCYFFITMCLMSCGSSSGDSASSVPVPGPTVTVTPEPVVSAPESQVQQLVDAENVYREGLGQSYLTPGLTCSVQLVGTGQWLSSSSPGYQSTQGVVTALSGSTSYSYLFQSSFNQPDSSSGVNSVIPEAVQSLYVGQNYKITCSGQLVATDTNYYNFDVDSDDGSILTVDGVQVVNNDGNHSITDKTGTKYLRQGVHTFNLSYAQSGSGNFGLVVNWNSNLIPGTVWYH